MEVSDGTEEQSKQRRKTMAAISKTRDNERQISM